MTRPSRDPEQEDPLKLVRFLARHALEGAVAGWVFMLLLIWVDVGELGTRLHASESRELLTVMLAISFGVTFALVGLARGVLFVLPKTD